MNLHINAMDERRRACVSGGLIRHHHDAPPPLTAVTSCQTLILQNRLPAGLRAGPPLSRGNMILHTTRTRESLQRLLVCVRVCRRQLSCCGVNTFLTTARTRSVITNVAVVFDDAAAVDAAVVGGS